MGSFSCTGAAGTGTTIGFALAQVPKRAPTASRAASFVTSPATVKLAPAAPDFHTEACHLRTSTGDEAFRPFSVPSAGRP